MLRKDVLDNLLFEIDLLRQSNTLIIVEGFRDKKCLVSLGFSRVITLYRKPLFKVVELVADKEKKVVILTDLDSEGKKIYSKLKSGLCERGVFVDDRFRNFLFKNTGLRQIEGLRSFLENNGFSFDE